MKIPAEIIVNSENDTQILAKEFAGILKPGDMVFLSGDLGSGKTFFVKSVCSNFNINNASSPSFAIVNEYEGDIKIYHFDFYRIKKPVELIDIGFEDYMNDDEAVTFIEWADLFPEVLPHKAYEISFEYLNETSRKIKIKNKN